MGQCCATETFEAKFEELKNESGQFKTQVRMSNHHGLDDGELEQIDEKTQIPVNCKYVTSMPECTDEFLLKIQKSVGPFVWEKCGNQIKLGYVNRNPVQFPSGTVYKGEWLNNKRHGRGI